MMIPIVDCRGASEDEMPSVGAEICAGLETTGAVYLQNYGIDYDEVKNLFTEVDKLWALPQDVKDRYARDFENRGHSGYIPPGVEKTGDDKGIEFREVYNIMRNEDGSMFLPNEELTQLQPSVASVYRQCHELSRKIVRQLSSYLGLTDRSFFADTHKGTHNSTMLRLMHYPPVPDNFKAEGDGGSVGRLGAHSDIGTITLIFQDDQGGLEMLPVGATDDAYIPMHPIRGSVLVIAGDLLQRWTSDRMIAVKHRVAPTVERSYRRRSILFFVNPDEDVVVAPLDGSALYPPVTPEEYIREMFKKYYPV